MSNPANMFDRRQRAYFIVSSKEGTATLSVDYPPGMQTLMVPIYPSCGANEYLPFLEPAFAHYVAQWSKIMVEDPAETDANGFWVDASTLPNRIADSANTEALLAVLKRHMPPAIVEYYGDAVYALQDTGGSSPWVQDNHDEICQPMDEFRIYPWPGA